MDGHDTHNAQIKYNKWNPAHKKWVVIIFIVLVAFYCFLNTIYCMLPCESCAGLSVLFIVCCLVNYVLVCQYYLLCPDFLALFYCELGFWLFIFEYYLWCSCSWVLFICLCPQYYLSCASCGVVLLCVGFWVIVFDILSII